MKKSLFLLLSFALAACSSTPPVVEVGVTQIAITQINQIVVTQIVQTAITQIVATLRPTQTPWIVTVTPLPPSPTPQFSPTPSLSPTSTMPPTNTTSPLFNIHLPGFYLVNAEIAPGNWRSLGQADDCYWEITDSKGDIISNHFGMAGGTMYIPSSAFQVRLEKECGTWEYLQP